MDEEAPRPVDDGAGWGTFIFAFLLIAVSAAGIRYYQREALTPKLAPELPEPVAAPPASSLTAPVKARGPRVPDGSREQGSLGFVAKNESMLGTAERDQEYDEALGQMSSGDRLSALMEGGGPPLMLSGDGGPSRFETRILRTRGEWLAFWKEVGGHDIPELDFTKKMAVVVFAGRQPAGSSVEILSAKPSGRRFLVKYRIKAAKAGGSSRPYQVVIVPISRLLPAFESGR